jgi:non-canonical purine NTP pyrophosphatase (RdgB/HAM1 family)
VAELGPFVLATTNPNKAREIREIFAGAGFSAELLARPAEVPEVEETEPTLLGNARLKVFSLVKVTGLAAMADDTGLEVDALGGAPGVRSARYAGEPPNDEANVDRVLAELARGAPGEVRDGCCGDVARWPGGQRGGIGGGMDSARAQGERRLRVRPGVRTDGV